MVENVIPYIGGEEEKSEQEPLRIWGSLRGRRDRKGKRAFGNHMPVRPGAIINGHTAAVFVKFRKKASKEQLIEKLVNFKGTSAGVRASERTEAVHPVYGRGQPSVTG